MRVPARLAAIVVVLGVVNACAFTVRSTLGHLPTRVEMRQLWSEPADLDARDLFYGIGGAALAPEPLVPFTYKSQDRTGASPKLEVRDAEGVTWNVKLGREAQPEVVVSRLAWAVGFHQPPTYFVSRWRMQGGPYEGLQAGGRFRPKLATLKTTGEWPWARNPFVGTRELKGLFVLMVMVNNWDLKGVQNKIYQSAWEARGVGTWFVVRDLGQSLGRTAWVTLGTCNDLDGFEREGFIKEVRDGEVVFHYRGAWRESHLKRGVTPADVVWIAERLDRLTPTQWSDAFRAGGYSENHAQRYIARLRQKVADGLALRSTVESR
jgi:hypothetical protein